MVAVLHGVGGIRHLKSKIFSSSLKAWNNLENLAESTVLGNPGPNIFHLLYYSSDIFLIRIETKLPNRKKEGVAVVVMNKKEDGFD